MFLWRNKKILLLFIWKKIPLTSVLKCITVDSVYLLNELISADECNDYERVEGLLCGTVKQLRDNRSKPDQLVYLTLLNLARSRPNMFNSDIVIEVFFLLYSVPVRSVGCHLFLL